ncbi:MAG: amidohydrolase family protein [Burkholderiales bacterium]|nr:amidohydrolase family protein [Burkholderiales bacterium]
MATVPPPMLDPSRPTFRLPAGTCDSHVHVYGPARVFPFSEGRAYTPDDAPAERLAALHRMLGVERVVFVQASIHGFDNRAMLDAVARDPARHRGVALLPVDATEAEMHHLHAGGVRGVRFSFMRHLGAAPDLDGVRRLAERMAPLGWHVQIYLDAQDLPELAPFLRSLPVPFVIDHFARVMVERGLDQAPLRLLLQLLEDERAWVKLSGPERVSAALSTGAFPYEDVAPLARLLAHAAPDRVVWGSDWPHPNVREIPDDGLLVDLLPRHGLDAAALQRLLVDNPARLYGF